MKKAVKNRHSEHGGASAKFLVFMAVLFLVVNAGYHFIPAAYAGESLKQDMQTAVVQGLAASGNMKPLELVKNKIRYAVNNNNIQSEVYIDVKQTNGVISARVYYIEEIPVIPFGIYNYKYEFDHTATPVGFLTKQ